MRIILSIIQSELKQRLFSWVSLIFFLMLVFQAIWYAKGSFDYFANEQVLMNAPSIIYRNYASMGMLMIIIIAISTGAVLYKDIQYKSAQWTYAMPINDKHFFIGRFSAAFLYLVIISTGLVIGHLLLPYSGIGEAVRFGSTPFGQIIHGWLLFTVPNLLFYVAIVFFAVVFTRRIATSYLAVFVVVIIFLIAQTSYETGGGNNLLAYLIVDPGGYVAAQNYTDLQTPLEKNTAYFELSGYILTNRLLWLGVAILLSFLAYFKFSFKYFIQVGTNQSKKISEENRNLSVLPSVKLPRVAKQFQLTNFLTKLWSLSKLEFLNIVRPTSFKIILGIILLMIFLQNVTWNATYYIGKEVPISSNMTFFRLQWGVFVTMLVMIWAGELFFKDKTVNIWQITDTLPVPIWVTQLSRFVAIIGLAFVLSLSFIAISIFTQILLGGAAYIDLGRFAEDLLLHRWAFLNFILWASWVFFVAALSGKRILTHILGVGTFLFLIVSFDLGILEDLRVGFGFTPGIEDYSEMSGYGIFQQGATWFFFLWLSLGAVFTMAGIWLWKRGSEKKWRNRISFTNKQLHPLSKVVLAMSFSVFIVLMSFVSKNVYQNGNFTPEAEEERLDALYEKKYKYIEAKPQPKYSKVDLKIDLFPSIRKATFEANLILENRLGIDTLYLNWKDFVAVKSLTMDGKALQLVKEDNVQNLTAYLVPSKNRKDRLLNLNLKAEKQYVGFTQNEFQADITYQGSFGSVQDFLPVIGYDSNKELLENRKREEQGIKKLTSRKAGIDNAMGLSQNTFTTDADLVTGSITISTKKGQIPFAAGQLLKMEEQAKRTVAYYAIKTPQVFNWHLGSSDYQRLTGKANKTAYTILHKPSHTFNVDLYQDALKKGVAFIEKQFGKGAVAKQLQLVEVHRWQEPKYTFANTIVLSEKEGWVADTKGLQEKAYIYQTIGSGLASLWIQKKLSIANVQGADMFVKALPEAIGLQFVKTIFGQEAVQLLTKKKMDKYGKDRNNEPNTEPSLLYADDTDYLEVNKGAVSLYKVGEEIGWALFYEELQTFASKQEKPSRFIDFFTLLKKHLDKETIKQFEEVK